MSTRSPMTCDEISDLLAALSRDALEPDEALTVLDHVQGCGLHRELADFAGVSAALGLSLEPAEPSPHVKARLLAAAVRDLAARPEERLSGSIAELRPIPPPRRRAWEPAFRLLAAAAVLVLVVWNVGLQARIGGLEDAIADVRAYDAAIADVLVVASRPDAALAILAPAEGSGPRGLAAVDASGGIVLAMRGLDPTAGTEVYEAWVIVGDAAPVPLGGFVVGPDGVAAFTASATAAGPGVILALTLEPAPGATAPTLPIVALGTASAPSS